MKSDETSSKWNCYRKRPVLIAAQGGSRPESALRAADIELTTVISRCQAVANVNVLDSVWYEFFKVTLMVLMY